MQAKASLNVTLLSLSHFEWNHHDHNYDKDLGYGYLTMQDITPQKIAKVFWQCLLLLRFSNHHRLSSGIKQHEWKLLLTNIAPSVTYQIRYISLSHKDKVKGLYNNNYCGVTDIAWDKSKCNTLTWYPNSRLHCSKRLFFTFEFLVSTLSPNKPFWINNNCNLKLNNLNLKCDTF